MSIKIMAKVWDIDLGNPIRKLVMLKLADNANDHGACWPSVESIARQCNCSERSVKGHISELKSMGIIEAKRQFNQSNYYTILVEALDAPLKQGQEIPLTQAAGAPEQGQEIPKQGQELPTNHKEPSLEPSKNHQGEIWPEFITKPEISEIKELKRKATKQKLTDRAQKLLCKELEVLHKAGYTMEQVLNTWAEFPHWKTFKADYLIGKQAPAGQAKRIIEKREQTTTEKTPEQKAKANEILGALRT